MATLRLVPINLKSRAGLDVAINGLDPTDHDCIKGTINTSASGQIDAEWNLSGLMRGGTPSGDCNLDMTLPEMVYISNLAQQLGAA
jgi:hypothetical protein